MQDEKALLKEDRKCAKYFQRLTIIKYKRDIALYKAKLKGMAEATLEIIEKMNNAKLSFDEISKFTGLPMEALNRLKL